MLWGHGFEVLSVIFFHVNFFNLFGCDGSSSICIVNVFNVFGCSIFGFGAKRELFVGRGLILLELGFICINAGDVLCWGLFIFRILDYFEIRLHYYN